MYSIGEFSKIHRITPKTLRHYEKIGLLIPSRVDDWTGYRYYESSQLPRMNRILTLRELGFSLTDIKLILDSPRELPWFLEKRAEQISESIQSEKKRLKRVNGLMKTLEGENEMKNQIIIKSLPTVTAASMRTTLETYDTYFEIMPKMSSFMKEVGAVCLEPAYCFTIYHDGEYKEQDIDVEICEAVVSPCKESEQVKFKKIPGFKEAACLFHKGPYRTMGESYNAVFTWIEENGYTLAGKPRESYIDGIWNRESEEDWLTEIQIPVKRK